MRYIIFIVGLITGLCLHNAVIRFIDFNASFDSWLTFYGAIGGGIITFLGVLLSLNHNQKMIKLSFEKEQLAKMRPWIKVEDLKSNIKLTQFANEAPLTIYRTEEFKNKEIDVEDKLNKLKSMLKSFENVQDVINIEGGYIFHVIENISDNPLLSSEYTLTFTNIRDNKNETLLVGLGDIRGKEKVYVPLPDQRISPYRIKALEIRGKSIYNEEMYYKEKYKDNNPVDIDVTYEKKENGYNREIKTHDCIYITKDTNQQYIEKHISN